MTVTVLAIVFIAVVVFVTIAGFRVIIKQGKPPDLLNTERCTICRETFDKSALVERQIGDYRILYFCLRCIERLAVDSRSLTPQLPPKDTSH